MAPQYTPAEEQFHTSSIYPKPKDWKGEVFQIRVDYPEPQGPIYPIRPGGGHPHHILDPPTGPFPPVHIPGDTPALPIPEIPVKEPWMKYNFKTHPKEYAMVVKEYCWEGNVNHDFVVQKNTVNQWYHAPWMHNSTNGREPLKGLTYERPIPAYEFAENQDVGLQNWAIGFYNAPGGSVFGGVWKDPNAPVWNDDLRFPKGSAVFKLLLTTATDKQVPTMVGSPEWPAVISPQSGPDAPSTGKDRNDYASKVRLIQVDWAVVDHRSPIGWVFGTFVFDGSLKHDNPWDRILPVGVMWGNDPELNQAAYDKGDRPKETWLNPDAEELRKKLGGKRPSWGYNDRLNGPADNFISACISCHGIAQSYAAPLVQDGSFDANGKWVPRNERLTMTWFQNVECGDTFSVRGALSCDYSLQFMIGWNNYQGWKATQAAQIKNKDPNKRILRAIPGAVGRKIVFRGRPGQDESDTEKERETLDDILDHVRVEEPPLRSGPHFDWGGRGLA